MWIHTITKIISPNTSKRLIMSKHPSSTPLQLPVVYLPLVALQHIMSCYCSSSGSLL
jgi:hypothetical protein